MVHGFEKRQEAEKMWKNSIVSCMTLCNLGFINTFFQLYLMRVQNVGSLYISIYVNYSFCSVQHTCRTNVVRGVITSCSTILMHTSGPPPRLKFLQEIIILLVVSTVLLLTFFLVLYKVMSRTFGRENSETIK